MWTGLTGLSRFRIKGYPGGVVKDVESEKVTRGSNEGFTDNIKINTALMRKRLQTPDLKIEQMQLGVRTNTLVNLIYMKGIVRPDFCGKSRSAWRILRWTAFWRAVWWSS